MSDLFDDRAAAPMLIGESSGPFSDPDWIFELKLDGERCLAYLGDGVTELRNKRGNRLLPKFPELGEIAKQVKKRCILDGELTVFTDGEPSFSELQRRIMLGGGLKAGLAAQRLPACLTVFDILYLDGRRLTSLALSERRLLLEKTVKESERLAVSRYIEGRGEELYELARSRALEGVVGKRMDSAYLMGRRTSEWIKIKYLLDDDFVVCGYIPGDGASAALVLGQYDGAGLRRTGHVTLGTSGEQFKKVLSAARGARPFEQDDPRDSGAVWLEPTLVCTAQFMRRTKTGGLRQPVFKSLRRDKRPKECVFPEEMTQ